MKPTAEIVATTADQAGYSTSCAQNSWTELNNIDVPNVDHEGLFVRMRVRTADVGDAIAGKVRIKHNSDYYPSSSGLRVYACAISGQRRDKDVLVTIPKNMANENIKLEYWNFDPTDNYEGHIEIWGHSAHKHQ